MGNLEEPDFESQVFRDLRVSENELEVAGSASLRSSHCEVATGGLHTTHERSGTSRGERPIHRLKLW